MVWDHDRLAPWSKLFADRNGQLVLDLKPAGPLGMLQQIDSLHDATNDVQAAASGACMHSTFWLKAKF